MGLKSAALNFDINSDFTPKLSPNFLLDLFSISKKGEKLNNCVNQLEDEMRKIQVFQRELPLSMALLSDAINKLKEEKMERIEDGGANGSFDRIKKMNWMSSVQLWSYSDQGQNCNYSKKQLAVDAMINNRTGVSLTIDSNLETNGIRTGLGLSLGTEANSSQTIKPRHSQRKQRRCWSPELHRKFVNALHQLGGAQVATPKQIKELMQEEDLTNDEIKSHLQKYRLHVRNDRASSSAPLPDLSLLSRNNNDEQESNPRTTQPGSLLHHLSRSS